MTSVSCLFLCFRREPGWRCCFRPPIAFVARIVKGSVYIFIVMWWARRWLRERKMPTVEPISHFFYSDRLKLQFWDYGQDGKPALVLVHGGLDHARHWDWVARELREDYHVYALDLRGHGNSAWAPGAMYSLVEHVLDLSALLDIINDFPVRLIGH